MRSSNQLQSLIPAHAHHATATTGALISAGNGRIANYLLPGGDGVAIATLLSLTVRVQQR